MLIRPPGLIPNANVPKRCAEPMGLLYIAASLKHAGYHDTTIYDMLCDGYDDISVLDNGLIAYGSSMEELRKRIIEHDPDLVGINCPFSMHTDLVLKMAKVVREMPGGGQRIIVTGGIGSSVEPERFIQSGLIDYVVMREGEERLATLIKHLDNASPTSRMPPEELDGVAYRNAEGECVIVPAARIILDLDVLPPVDRSLIDMEKYLSLHMPFSPFTRGRRVAHVLTSRGCPNNCVFCSIIDFWGRKVRMRSVNNTMAELIELVDRYGVDEVQFIDDNLTVDMKRAKELFIRMKPLGLKWCTPNGLFFNSVDEEMVRLMAESGAYQLTFALESASPRVLREIIQKNVRLDAVRNIVAEAHKYDIGVHGIFIIGLPGETREELEMTLRFPYEVEFDSIGISVASPRVGTRLYRECFDKGYLSFSEGENKLISEFALIRIPENSTEYVMSPEEYHALATRATREFSQWSEHRFPERHAAKFARYLQDHPEQSDKIHNRFK